MHAGLQSAGRARMAAAFRLRSANHPHSTQRRVGIQVHLPSAMWEWHSLSAARYALPACLGLGWGGGGVAQRERCVVALLRMLLYGRVPHSACCYLLFGWSRRSRPVTAERFARGVTALASRTRRARHRSGCTRCRQDMASARGWHCGSYCSCGAAGVPARRSGRGADQIECEMADERRARAARRGVAGDRREGGNPSTPHQRMTGFEPRERTNVSEEFTRLTIKSRRPRPFQGNVPGT